MPNPLYVNPDVRDLIFEFDLVAPCVPSKFSREDLHDAFRKARVKEEFESDSKVKPFDLDYVDRPLSVRDLAKSYGRGEYVEYIQQKFF